MLLGAENAVGGDVGMLEKTRAGHGVRVPDAGRASADAEAGLYDNEHAH